MTISELLRNYNDISDLIFNVLVKANKIDNFKLPPCEYEDIIDEMRKKIILVKRMSGYRLEISKNRIWWLGWSQTDGNLMLKENGEQYLCAIHLLDRNAVCEIYDGIIQYEKDREANGIINYNHDIVKWKTSSELIKEKIEQNFVNIKDEEEQNKILR